MALGPGKYDDVATIVRELTDAAAVIVLVIEGNQGSGFSVQTTLPNLTAENLAKLLENMARQLREE
jgi:predicted ATP-grasp superfamily ATP-dependent carboligase